MENATRIKLCMAAAWAGAVLAAPATASAEAFVAAAGLGSQWPSNTCSYEGCDRRGTGWMARAGWMFAPWIGVEARAFDLGKSRNGTPEVTIADLPAFAFGGDQSDANGAGIGVVGAWPVTNEVTLTATAGIARTRATVWRTETTSSGVQGSGVVTSSQYLEGRGNEAYYALGMDYYLMPAIALSVDVQRTHLPVSGMDPVDSVSLGVTVRWR